MSAYLVDWSEQPHARLPSAEEDLDDMAHEALSSSATVDGPPNQDPAEQSHSAQDLMCRSIDTMAQGFNASDLCHMTYSQDLVREDSGRELLCKPDPTGTPHLLQKTPFDQLFTALTPGMDRDGVTNDNTRSGFGYQPNASYLELPVKEEPSSPGGFTSIELLNTATPAALPESDTWGPFCPDAGPLYNSVPSAVNYGQDHPDSLLNRPFGSPLTGATLRNGPALLRPDDRTVASSIDSFGLANGKAGQAGVSSQELLVPSERPVELPRPATEIEPTMAATHRLGSLPPSAISQTNMFNDRGSMGRSSKVASRAPLTTQQNPQVAGQSRLSDDGKFVSEVDATGSFFRMFVRDDQTNFNEETFAAIRAATTGVTNSWQLPLESLADGYRIARYVGNDCERCLSGSGTSNCHSGPGRCHQCRSARTDCIRSRYPIHNEDLMTSTGEWPLYRIVQTTQLAQRVWDRQWNSKSRRDNDIKMPSGTPP